MDDADTERARNRIVDAGRVGPFTVHVDLVAKRDDTVICRALVRDNGAVATLVAVAERRARTTGRKVVVQ